MRIAVVGLGAVGGLVAGWLAAAGHEVTAIARGATLARVRERGLDIDAAGQRRNHTFRVTDDAATVGPQELVVVALKAPSLLAAADSVMPIIGPATVILPAMNGVPWWFMPASPAFASDAALESVDPGGRLLARLPLAQVLGCVVHLTCSSPEPGVVRHGFGQRLIVGEPQGGLSARVEAVCQALASAGFQAEPSADIRSDVWYKLWGNMTMNPVSALTGALTDAIVDDALVREFILRCMAEAAAIGARIGCPIVQSGEARLAIARELGGFRTSMLQDAEAGRAIELDALVTAVHEIGERVGIEAPNIAALLGLTRLMGRTRGLYPR